MKERKNDRNKEKEEKGTVTDKKYSYHAVSINNYLLPLIRILWKLFLLLWNTVPQMNKGWK